MTDQELIALAVCGGGVSLFLLVCFLMDHFND